MNDCKEVFAIRVIKSGLSVCALSFGLIGCSSANKEAASHHTDSILTDEELTKYQSEIQVAWEFVKKKGWDDLVKGDWKNASVDITDTTDGHMLDGEPERDEVLKVAFISKENLMNGVPCILVDLEKKEVIGYVPTE